MASRRNSQPLLLRALNEDALYQVRQVCRKFQPRRKEWQARVPLPKMHGKGLDEMKSYADFGIDAPSSGTGEYRTACPNCEPRRQHKGNKDLSVNLSAGTWYCHHCDWAGALPKHDPLRQTRGSGQSKPEGPKNSNLTFSVFPLAQETIKWLSSRGISEDTAILAKVGAGKVYSHKQSKEIGAVAFPVYRDGEIVNVKYRTLEFKEFSQTKGGDQSALFNGDSMNGSDTIIFTEGEMDALSILEAGYPCAVSCPNGAPPVGAKNLESKLSFIQANQAAFDAAKEIVLAMDKDEPGIAFEKIMSRQLGVLKCKTVVYPEGCKDANEVLLKHGKAKLVECIDHAKDIPSEGITNYQLHVKELQQYRLNEFQDSIFSTGLHTLDEYWKLEVGTLNIVTGIPSHGKSEFLDQIVVNTIKLLSWKWAIFSPENYPMAAHFQKLSEKLTGKRMFKAGENAYYNGVDIMDDKDFAMAIAKLGQHIDTLTITEANDLDNIMNRIEVCISKHGLNAFILDPWNEIEHKRTSAHTETEYISMVLSKLRNFSRLRKVTCFLVAHPSKLKRDLKGNYPVPTPYDISGSAHFRNKADICLCVWRDIAKKDGSLEVHIQKVRNRNAGKAGNICKLVWNQATGIIRDKGYET